MEDLEEVYNELDNRQYSKEEYASYKQKERQEIFDLLESQTEKISKNSNEFKKYLDTQSNFDQYSVANNILISAQMPEATRLKDYDGWKNLRMFPKRGHKRVKILDVSGHYIAEDGSVRNSYDVKYLVDVSELRTRPRIRPIKYNDKILLKIFLNSTDAKVEVVDNIPNTEKSALYNVNEDTLYIKKGAVAPQIFYEVTNELAKREIGEDSFKNNCVSYMLCKKYDIDVSKFNFSNISQQFENMDTKQVRADLEPTQRAMKSISDNISRQIHSIIKENRQKER